MQVYSAFFREWFGPLPIRVSQHVTENGLKWPEFRKPDVLLICTTVAFVHFIVAFVTCSLISEMQPLELMSSTVTGALSIFFFRFFNPLEI